MTSRPASPPATWLVLILFLCSGFSSLVYQVVWTRQLTLVFGVTTYAVSAVLSSFFAGLGLGSFAAGKIADRRGAGLATYGWIEIAIGLYALLVPSLLDVTNGVYRLAYQELGASFTALSFLRLVMSALVLIVPTTLMGATLPIMTRSLVRRLDRAGMGIAGLYAVNTLGAMLGVAAAGFVLIGAVGLLRTTLIAAALNVAIGVAAVIAGRLHSPGVVPPERQPVADAAHLHPPALLRRVIVCLGVSGIASLAYEVVWTRILAMFLSSSGSTFTASLLGDYTTYAFSAMLSSVLFGIVLGSLWIAPRLDRMTDPIRALALFEVLVGLATLVAGLVIALVLPGRGQTFILLVAFFILLVPNALLGATVPIGGKVHARSLPRLGRAIGDVYSANVLGGVLGSFLAGFVLIPLAGSQGTLILLAVVNVALGVWLAQGIGWRRAPAVPAVAAVSVLLAAVFAAQPGGLMRGIFRALFPRHEVVFTTEEASGMVTVTQRSMGDAANHFLLINGEPQASDEAIGVLVHRQLAHIPLLLHPDPKEILVIGLGAGTTVAAAARHADVERIDLVELVPGTLEAAPYFGATNFEVWKDPRVTVMLNDGRNYLLVSDKKYDVIEADIISPRRAMATNLYSLDYFQLIKAHLKPGGVVCQWFDTSLPPELYRILLRTFLDVFPNTTIWRGGMFGVALPEGMSVDEALRDRLRRRFADPELRVALHLAGLPSAERFLHTYSMGPGEVRAYVGSGEVVRDDRPYLEYFRSKLTGAFLPTHVDPSWR